MQLSNHRWLVWGQRMKERGEQKERERTERRREAEGEEERDSCNWSCLFLTTVREGLGLLSRELFTLLLLMAKECNGERGEGRGTDNCIQYFHSTIILTAKLNSSPNHHFSNSLFFGSWRWKTFFFLSQGLARHDSTTFRDTHIPAHNTQQTISPPV